jgi:protein-L-isoaspartate(D-aspartate) O-methyltransferase
MVERLASRIPGLSEASRAALRRVERHRFVPELFGALAYNDTAVPLGRAHTLPAPSTVATILAAADVQPGNRVLIVGSGTGYLTALCAEIGATVYVAEGADQFLRKHEGFFETYPAVSRRYGIGFDTWQDAAPFDVIIVHGAVDGIPEIAPQQLGGQGRLVAPLADPAGIQILIRMTIMGARVSIEALGQSFFGTQGLDEAD